MKILDYCDLPTSYGTFRMYDTGNEGVRLISFGDVYKQTDRPLVRMHSSCLASEVFGAIDCDCADQLRESMKQMASEESGIIIHLHQEGRGQGLSNKIRAVYKMQSECIDTVESFEMMGLDLDVRDYVLAINILKALGITKLRLISNNPRKKKALTDHDFDVESVNTNPTIRPENVDYLFSKNAKLGHCLPLVKESSDDSDILFYHSDQPWGEFSNFSQHSIYLNGKIWPTVEHYYHAQKYLGTEIEHEIRQARTPIQAKQLAHEHAQLAVNKDWQNVKESVMMNGLRAKFTQHPNLTKLLCNTNSRRIAEHTRNDNYWGDGVDGNGKNRLGELLMMLRNQLIKNEGN